MTGHQLENGYTKIANSIFELLYEYKYPGSCLKVILWVIRNSYGYQRKFTYPTSTRKMAKDMKSSKTSIANAIKILRDFGVIIPQNTGFLFNKNALNLFTTAPKHGHLKSIKPPRNQGETAPKSGRNRPETRTPDIYKEERKKERKKGEGKSSAPTLLEVLGYCKEAALLTNGEKFYNTYQAQGWKIGNSEITDWRAKLKAWAANDYIKTPKSDNKEQEWKEEREMIKQRNEAIRQLENKIKEQE